MLVYFQAQGGLDSNIVLFIVLASHVLEMFRPGCASSFCPLQGPGGLGRIGRSSV